MADDSIKALSVSYPEMYFKNKKWEARTPLTVNDMEQITTGIKANRDAINNKALQPGKSAYEIAVEHGFEGSETEWLASLQGEDGEPGPQGPIGEGIAIMGEGETGKANCTKIGHCYLVGTNLYALVGFDENGNKQFQDLGSLRGPQGLQGPQGQKGDKGDKGDTGLQGEPGPAPTITENGFWQIGDTVTEVKAKGEDGSSVTVTKEEETSEGKKVTFSDGNSVTIPYAQPATVTEVTASISSNTEGGNPSVKATLQKNENDPDYSLQFDFKNLKGDKGLTPTINKNGYWVIGNEDTGVKAKGDKGDYYAPQLKANGDLSWELNGAVSGTVNIKGPQGDKGDPGEKGQDGKEGPRGYPGATWHSGEKVKYENETVIIAEDFKGQSAADDLYLNVKTYDIFKNYQNNSPDDWQYIGNIKGITPTFSAGTTTTKDPGTNAAVNVTKDTSEEKYTFDFFIPQGKQGNPGNDGRSITSVELSNSFEGTDTYTITYSDGETDTFTITNGKDGTSSYWYWGTDFSKEQLDIYDGGDYKNKDLYLNKETYDVLSFNETSYSWDYVGNIKGKTGDKGEDGDDGTPGTKWYTGVDVWLENNETKVNPTFTAGDYNDLYLNTNTYDLFIRGDGDTWHYLNSNIKGEKGNTPIFNVVETTTLEPSKNATVTQVNTSSDYINLKFGIPKGDKGNDGHTPIIKINESDKHWYIDNNDTGVKAKGEDGAPGKDGSSVTITKIVESKIDQGSNTITFDDGGTLRTLTIYNGSKGEKGDQGTGVNVKASEGACTEIGDAYINTNGDLLILTNTNPREFTNGGQIKGPKGDKGDPGDDGINGTDGKSSIWHYGTAITGTGGTGDEIKVTNLNLYSATIGDMYLNTETCNVYSFVDNSQETGDTGKWVYAGNIKGDKGQTGDTGAKGESGQNGENGFSPTIYTSVIPGGHRLSITDINDNKTIDVMNGKDGRGIKTIGRTNGNGSAGTVDTYTITYSDNTTSTFGVYNGKDGQNGKNGEDGKDGTSVTHSWNGTTLNITSASGTSSANLKGKDGADGNTPQLRIDESTRDWEVSYDNGNSWENTGFSSKGEKGDDGQDGSPGAAASIRIGTVETGAPGTNAVVENRGSSADALLYFSIPQGIQGPQGETGPQGPDGPQGPIGRTPDIDFVAGFNINKTDTPTVALRSDDGQGNKTFELNYLKGQKGDPGPQGPSWYNGTEVYLDGETVVYTGESDSFLNGDLYLNTNTYDVFIYQDGWKYSKNIMGAPGPSGDTGLPGKAATITVGNTTTGSSWDNASVTRRVGSTDQNVILDFVIPRGPDGHTPEITEGGYWKIGSTTTNIPAKGQTPQFNENCSVSVDNSSLDYPTATVKISNADPLKPQLSFDFKGLKGKDGEDGKDGTGINIKASANDCQIDGDAYIDSSGNLRIKTGNTFKNAGKIVGPAGKVWYPSVNNQGDLTWTLKEEDSSKIPLVNIKGPDGRTPTLSIENNAFYVSYDGGQSTEYLEDIPMPNITISEDGYWVIEGEKTNVKALGEDGAQGPQGPQGPQGEPGENGISPTVTTTEIENGYRITINDKDSSQTFEIYNGRDGDGASITVDSELKDDSANPVENKIVTAALKEKAPAYNSKPSAQDPGVGSELDTGVLLFIFEEE